ncbi:serine O-acetyltransferase [Nocardioides jiangxiensis]|uniref:DapH/DapD/GlmU-related protein n=1 Tax=Nocardioides jiangxiensis TaxID=3064524 RepID=A0ABT9AZ99_9ACTN|nr:DapH/DapD/GlmU-related protein [Nocardioides sp. WY-20]MDO7867864.1 DapH/DapD/GlmU-related protein [Nocardioides sp. WY-20]
MWSLIAADLKANVDHTRVPGPLFWVKVIGKLVVTPQVQVVVLYRIGQALARTPLRPLAFVLRAWGVMISGAEIHPDARIGPGFALMHSSGVVIGGGVVAGRGLRMAQGATLGEPGRGGDPAAWGFPVVGHHVTIGANATVVGPRHLGDGCVVGANSVVTRDVPELTVVGGMPAKELKTVGWELVLGRPLAAGDLD